MICLHTHIYIYNICRERSAHMDASVIHKFLCSACGLPCSHKSMVPWHTAAGVGLRTAAAHSATC